MKLTAKMENELYQAAAFGYQGELVPSHRATEEALIRRGLLTYDYNDTTFYTPKAYGYRNPVLTVAGWEAAGGRPADDIGRMTVEEAWMDIYARAAEAIALHIR